MLDNKYINKTQREATKFSKLLPASLAASCSAGFNMPLSIFLYNVFGYAPGSVLLQMGGTKVLCAVSLENSVLIHTDSRVLCCILN